MLIVSITTQEILSRLYFVFTMSESEWHDRPIEEKSYLDDKIEEMSVFLNSTIFTASAIDEDANACHKAVAMLIVSITTQEILSRLYFVFTRCLKTSTSNMALSDFIINLTT
jgi:hypothetical protein